MKREEEERKALKISTTQSTGNNWCKKRCGEDGEGNNKR